MKKVIILLSILLTIILIALIGIGNNLNFKNTNVNELNTNNELEKTLQQVQNMSEYDSVKQCVDRYYLFCAMTFDAKVYYNSAFESLNGNNEQTREDIEEEIRQQESKNAIKIYNILDEQLKIDQAITTQNIITKLNKIEMSTVNITNIYVSEKSNNINVYLVKGMLKGETTQKISDFQIIVKMDTDNNTFGIIPQQFIENNLEIGQEPKIEVPEKIQANDNNTYKTNSISEEKYIKSLFTKLTSEIYNFPELVYNRLDEEYRNKKYPTFAKFQDYINNNKQKFSTMKIDSYKKEVTDDYIQYLCLDSNENNYIFRENAVMDYSLILDVYTVDLPEIVQKYDSSEASTKVVLNIGKLKEATRNGDYEYVYSKLNATFKANNFNTLEQFEQFIKERYNPKEDTLEYKLYKQVTGIHVYGIEIKDVSENRIIEADIIMNLKDNRDFEFSFSLGD